MIAVRLSVILVAVVIGGCASTDPQAGQRTVFNNPYAAPVIDRTGIGPQCDEAFGRDATCLGAPLIYPGRGRNAARGDGETIRLTRAQARILRDRAALIEALGKQPVPPPPPTLPPVFPTAAETEDETP
jgi:hypothetical protein